MLRSSPVVVSLRAMAVMICAPTLADGVGGVSARVYRPACNGTNGFVKAISTSRPDVMHASRSAGGSRGVSESKSARRIWARRAVEQSKNPAVNAVCNCSFELPDIGGARSGAFDFQ